MHNKMIASVVKAADAFLCTGAGLGAARWGQSLLCGEVTERPAPPLTHKKCSSNTRLTPRIFFRAEIPVIPAFFIGR